MFLNGLKSLFRNGIIFWILVVSPGYSAPPICSTLVASSHEFEFSSFEQEVIEILKSQPMASQNPKVVEYFSRPPAQIQSVLVLKFFASQMRAGTQTTWATGLLEGHLNQVLERTVEELIQKTGAHFHFQSDLRTVLNNGFRFLKFKSWARLAKFSQSLFSDSEFRELIAFGIRGFQLRMEAENLHPGLSQYLRYKLIKESLKRELGLPFEIISDVSVFEAGPALLSVVAFSTEPMDGDLGDFGFAYRKLSDIPRIKHNQSHVVSWKSGAREHQATILIQSLGRFSLVPKVSAAPDYQGMLADGRLTGAILFSGNLGAFVSDLTEVYDEYLRSEGFRKTSEQVLGFEEAQASLASKIQTMEIDYMLREGHGHPSAWGLVNLTSNVRITQYQLNTRGRRESLYLIAPAHPVDHPEDRSLTQGFLGDALRGRTQPTQQFLYVDTSCQGAGDLCALSKGVSAVGFTPVASDKEVATMTVSDGDPVYEILHGIRNQKSYRTILKALVVKDENGAVIEHGFTFPNSPEYILRKSAAELKRRVPRYSVQIQR